MVNTKVKELQNIAKYFTVLYAEDQDDIRVFTASILKNFFKSVEVAKNGQEGFELFAEKQIDLIITDIMMPKLNGLEMIREIKTHHNKAKDIPFIVTTAFGDTDHFLDSITLGVDRYVIKPINPNLFIDSLYSVCKNIYDNRRAKIYEKRLIKSKLEKEREKTMQIIAESFPVACAVVSADKLIFANKLFKEIVNEETFEKLSNADILLEHFLMSNNLKGNHIKMPNSRIYKVDISDIDIDGVASSVYALSDITIIEYQKTKIDTMNLLLKDVLFTKFKSDRERISQSTTEVTNDKEEPKENLGVKKSGIILSEEEINVLRRSRNEKFSASDYMEEIEETIIDEILEFGDLEHDWIEMMEKRPSFEVMLKKSIDIFAKYSLTIKKLMEFNDLSFAINSLVNTLSNIDINVTASNHKKIEVIIRAIADDLRSWRESVFVQKNAIDIHYLDSSLFSSFVQLDVELNGQSNDDCELELF